MTNDIIYERLTAVLRDVFDDDTLVAAPELVASQVAGWDSLGHIRLLVEVERVFTIRFTSAEVSSLKDLGQLATVIARKHPDVN